MKRRAAIQVEPLLAEHGAVGALDAYLTAIASSPPDFYGLIDAADLALALGMSNLTLALPVRSFDVEPARLRTRTRVRAYTVQVRALSCTEPQEAVSDLDDFRESLWSRTERLLDIQVAEAELRCGTQSAQALAARFAKAPATPETARARAAFGRALLDDGKRGAALPHLRAAADTLDGTRHRLGGLDNTLNALAWTSAVMDLAEAGGYNDTALIEAADTLDRIGHPLGAARALSLRSGALADTDPSAGLDVVQVAIGRANRHFAMLLDRSQAHEKVFRRILDAGQTAGRETDAPDEVSRFAQMNPNTAWLGDLAALMSRAGPVLAALSDASPEAFEERHLQLYRTVSIGFSELGDIARAVEASTTFVRLARHQMAERPTDHPWTLAWALTRHGRCLNAVGERGAALAALRESADLHARVLARDRGHASVLQTVCDEITGLLAADDDWSTALRFATRAQAARACRTGLGDPRDAVEGLTRTITLAHQFSRVGQAAVLEDTRVEALRYLARVGDYTPDELVRALLDQGQRRVKALAPGAMWPFAEAISIAHSSRSADLLAVTLGETGGVLSGAGRQAAEAARPLLSRAVEVARALADRSPQEHLGLLLHLMEDLARCLAELDSANEWPVAIELAELSHDLVAIDSQTAEVGGRRLRRAVARLARAARWVEAADLLERVRQRKPTLVSPAWLAAERAWLLLCARRHGVDLDEAGREAARAVELDPEKLWPRRLQGLINREKGAYDDALADFTDALGVNPDDVEVRRDRAHLYLVLGNQSAAHTDLEEILRLRDDSSSYGFRAKLYLAEGLPEPALADSTRALALEPDALWLRYLRALALMASDHLEEAADLLHDAVLGFASATPPDLEDIVNLGLCHTALNLPEPALACFARVARAGPTPWLLRQIDADLAELLTIHPPVTELTDRLRLVVRENAT